MKSRATQISNERFRTPLHTDFSYAHDLSGAFEERPIAGEGLGEDHFAKLYKESLKGLREGTIIEGKIKAVTEFGIFIRIDQGIEGLVHISNISRGRIGHPAEAYRIGDRVEAKVLDLDRELERVSLGKREMAPQ